MSRFTVVGGSVTSLVENVQRQRLVLPIHVGTNGYVQKAGFTIRREEKSGEPLFRVLGTKPVRWVQQTDFTNDEAVGYLSDRLAKLGVASLLEKCAGRRSWRIQDGYCIPLTPDGRPDGFRVKASD